MTSSNWLDGPGSGEGACASCDALRADAALWRERYAEKASALVKARAAVERFRAGEAAADRIIVRLRDEIEQCKAERDGLHAEVERLRGADEETERLKALASKAMGMRTDALRERDEARAEVGRLVPQLREMGAELLRVAKDRNDLLCENSTTYAVGYVDNLHAEVERLKAELAQEMDESNTAVRDLRAELARVEAEVERLKAALADSEACEAQRATERDAAIARAEKAEADAQQRAMRLLDAERHRDVARDQAQSLAVAQRAGVDEIERLQRRLAQETTSADALRAEVERLLVERDLEAKDCRQRHTDDDALYDRLHAYAARLYRAGVAARVWLATHTNVSFACTPLGPLDATLDAAPESVKRAAEEPPE